MLYGRKVARLRGVEGTLAAQPAAFWSARNVSTAHSEHSRDSWECGHVPITLSERRRGLRPRKRSGDLLPAERRGFGQSPI